MQLTTEMRQDEVLWLLGSLCSVFRIPFDAALLAQACPPPTTLATLHEAARALGLKTGGCRIAGADWQRLPLPAIALLKPAVVTGAEAPRALGAILVVKASADQILYFRPGSQSAAALPIDEALETLEPEVVLVARQTAGGDEDDIAGFARERQTFGFRWFLPELLKHRQIWRDVLLASLAIQLVGLATPLFTQVIIDKVIVHQSDSTLLVLAVALGMFMLFTLSLIHI